MSHIGNMDVSPMNFDTVGNRAEQSKRVRTVLLKASRRQKNRFWVTFTCMAKLKPMLIFQKKNNAKNYISIWNIFVLVRKCLDEMKLNLGQKAFGIGDLVRYERNFVWCIFTYVTKSILSSLNIKTAINISCPAVNLNKPHNVRVVSNEWIMKAEMPTPCEGL